MAKNYFKRYIWLIDLLNRRGPISTQQIKEAWLHSPLNPQCQELSERTFFNHKDAILDLFGIHIVNDRTLGFSIKDFNMGDDAMENWMLHLLCLNNILQENSDMKDRILVDNVPSSERFLTEVISAMRNSKVIHLYYKSFRSQVTSDFDVEPYCVKHFKQRWYMLGKSSLGLRVYSLDRFVDMEEIQEEFDLPANFDAEIFFSDYFGVIVGGRTGEHQNRGIPGPDGLFPHAPPALLAEGTAAGGRKFDILISPCPDIRFRTGTALARKRYRGAVPARPSRANRTDFRRDELNVQRITGAVAAGRHGSTPRQGS